MPVVAAINDDRGTKNVCVLVCATWKKTRRRDEEKFQPMS